MAPLIDPVTLDKVRRYLEPIEVTAHGRYTRKVRLPKEWAKDLRRIENEALAGRARGAGGAVTPAFIAELVEQGVLKKDEPVYMWVYRSPLIMQELRLQEEEREALARDALLPRESRPKTAAELRASR